MTCSTRPGRPSRRRSPGRWRRPRLGTDRGMMHADGAAPLMVVLDRLGSGMEDEAGSALSLLQETMTDLGSRPINRLRSANGAIRVRRLQHLALRLRSSKLEPGLTIHQAKGLRVGARRHRVERLRRGAVGSWPVAGQRNRSCSLRRPHRRLAGLQRSAPSGYTRKATVLSASTEPAAHVVIPAVHRVASLLRRWLLGTSGLGAARTPRQPRAGRPVRGRRVDLAIAEQKSRRPLRPVA